MSDSDERRRYFRLDDSVHLSIQPVPPQELRVKLQRLEHEDVDSFTVMTSLGEVSQQLSTSLRRIEQSNPDVAEYLKAIDKKIEVLGKALFEKETEFTKQPTRPVNLSAGGMGLHSQIAFELGSPLEVRILLLPSYTGLHLFGEVVSCEPNENDPEYPYGLRINFTHIRENDREALIRHLLRRQGEQLREQRED